MINFIVRLTKEDDWYITHYEDLPGAISQGKDLKEVKANVKGASSMSY